MIRTRAAVLTVLIALLCLAAWSHHRKVHAPKFTATHFVVGVPDRFKASDREPSCPANIISGAQYGIFDEVTVNGIPCLVGGRKAFPVDPNEPLQALYDASAWVHSQGGGRLEVDPKTIGKGKYLDYFGPENAKARPHWWSFAWLFSDRAMGGDCFCRLDQPARVYVTIKK